MVAVKNYTYSINNRTQISKVQRDNDGIVVNVFLVMNIWIYFVNMILIMNCLPFSNYRIVQILQIDKWIFKTGFLNVNIWWHLKF